MIAAADSVNFGRYGKAFQEGLVQLIFEDRSFADQITEVLNIHFLDLQYLRVFIHKVVTYRAKYNKHPSVEAMMTIIQTELEKEDQIIQQQVREYFHKIHTREITDVDFAFHCLIVVADGSAKYTRLSVLVGPDTGMIFLGAYTKRMAEHLSVGPNFHDLIEFAGRSGPALPKPLHDGVLWLKVLNFYSHMLLVAHCRYA